MKYSKSQVCWKTHRIPDIQFEEQQLTSFSGLVLFHKLFCRLQMKSKLRSCFGHLKSSAAFQHAVVFLLLVVHLLVGYRRLRDVLYYRTDPLVKRLLGLKILPNVSTVSRTLASCDCRSAERVRGMIKNLCLDRLGSLHLSRVTADFDGSVQSTARSAEGTAVGFNKKKKGARSYYPLFCTIAQTGQVFDTLHRPGNVHDSKGARAFILNAFADIRNTLPNSTREARMDAAFFGDEMVSTLESIGIKYTISVPFERFPELKTIIEARKRWKRLDDDLSCFEAWWKPHCWQQPRRFLFIRQKVKKISKEPLQLDLFIPQEYGYDFKVILTNKSDRPKSVLLFHNGRGAQEGILAELKSQCQAGYVPVKTRVGNELYLLAGILAHNLTRELQMIANPQIRRPGDPKRAPNWIFSELSTLRRNIIQRAGKVTRPKGRLTLTIGATAQARRDFLHYLERLHFAA